MSDEEKPVVPAEAPADPAPPAPPPRADADVPPEADPPPAPPPVTEPPRRSGAGVFAAALLGGALAAAGGFAISHYNLLHLRTEPDLTAWETRLAALDSASAETKAALAKVQEEARTPAPPPDLSAVTARIDALEASIAAAVKASDGGVTPAALAALQAQVDALKSGGDVRAVVQEEMARWQETATQAASAEAEAARNAALKAAARATLHEAVASGAPYAAALQALELPEPPAALVKHAETGLPTLTALADSFPEAARLALAAAPSTGGGFWGFLQHQVGARSLTPQEGATPDAILSRAEAAVKAGDLPRALEELAALPPESQAALAGWTAAARERVEAEQALSSLPSAAP